MFTPANAKYPLYGEFEVEPIAVEGYAEANGVYVNVHGEPFVGDLYDVVLQDGSMGKSVMPYWGDDGQFIPAPDGWRERIVRQVQ